MSLALILSVEDSSGSQLLEPHWISILVPAVMKTSIVTKHNTLCSSHYSPSVSVVAEPELAPCPWLVLTQSPVVTGQPLVTTHTTHNFTH